MQPYEIANVSRLTTTYLYMTGSQELPYKLSLTFSGDRRKWTIYSAAVTRGCSENDWSEKLRTPSKHLPVKSQWQEHRKKVRNVIKDTRTTPFYTLWKCQKTCGFLTFSGDTKWRRSCIFIANSQDIRQHFLVSLSLTLNQLVIVESFLENNRNFLLSVISAWLKFDQDPS